MNDEAEKEEREEERDAPEELTRLKDENERLQRELEKIRAQNEREEERKRGAARLRELTGTTECELFTEAARRAEEQEELRSLPAEKRYEMSYYLILGERSGARGGKEAAGEGQMPVFVRSSGGAGAPAASVKPPVNFEMARENAKKYFGVD